MIFLFFKSYRYICTCIIIIIIHIYIYIYIYIKFAHTCIIIMFICDLKRSSSN